MSITRTVWQLLEEHYLRDSVHGTPGDVARIIDSRTRSTPALDLIDRRLVKALDTPDSRLIITMPPQEGKSTRVARDLPVWDLVECPVSGLH